jgi:hypothetical protein
LGLSNGEVAALLAGGFEDRLLKRCKTRLHLAARAGLPARVNAPLEPGADPNECSLAHAAPLYWAKDPEIIALLQGRTTGEILTSGSSDDEYDEEGDPEAMWFQDDSDY